jgi:DNA-binding transcriptional ArsR family regulator
MVYLISSWIVGYLNDLNGRIIKAIAHPIKRRIIECLQDGNLSFIELLNMVGESDHGNFGYHLRTLKEFVELEPSKRKYRLTDRGRLLVGLIRDIRSITLIDSEYAKYVQNLRLGDHAVAFYTTDDFERKISFACLKAGLLQREAVVYLVSENKLDSEIREIQRYGIDLSSLQKEAFSIMSAYEWYVKKGKAQAETITTNWMTLLEEKKKAGFTGLRVVAEVEVFVDYAKTTELLRYEELVGRQINVDLCALCLYAEDRFDEKQFIQAGRLHGHLISNGIVGKMI